MGSSQHAEGAWHGQPRCPCRLPPAPWDPRAGAGSQRLIHTAQRGGRGCGAGWPRGSAGPPGSFSRYSVVSKATLNVLGKNMGLETLTLEYDQLLDFFTTYSTLLWGGKPSFP